jgi:hypothetical protein
MGEFGTPEYVLRWSRLDTPLGAPICALRASARTAKSGLCVAIHLPSNGRVWDLRTSGNGCSSISEMSGWPTPNAMPPNRGGLQSNPEKAMKRRQQGHQFNLDDAACIAGWSTCSSRDWKDTPGMAATGVNPDGSIRYRADQLPRQAALAGWPTPDAQAMNVGADPEKHMARLALLKEKHGNGNGAGLTLGIVSGLTSISSPAPMEKRGALNPAFAAWLMQLPVEWCQAMIRAQRTLKQSAKRGRRASAGTETPSCGK